MTAPSPFSEHNPKLQRAWDSTSLRALMFCPRYYEYTIIEGFRGSTLDLEFGVLAHTAWEAGSKVLCNGGTWEQAQFEAVRVALYESLSPGEERTWVPWGGIYTDQWRCKGEVKYRNKKGNPAKCPYSHAGKWHDTEAPSVCGECGSDIEASNNWLPRDKVKDRVGLVRMIVWYYEEYKDGTGPEPYVFPDGTPAVELSFKLPLPWASSDGEPFIICGHLDKLESFGPDHFWGDHKTTKKTLGKGYWDGFTPNIQADVYDLASWLMFPDLEIRGGIIDGVQLMAGGARFGKHTLYRTEQQREELLTELEWWLKQAERYAEQDFWPMNRSSCWLCNFNGICSKEPSMRQRYLEGDFQRKHWNPLEER